MSVEHWENEGGYTPPDLDTVRGCARCGGNHIRCIDWRRFRRVVEDSDGPWTHWALCPVSGDPILMKEE